MEAIQRKNYEFYRYQIENIILVDIEKYKHTNIYYILDKRLRLAKIFSILNEENKENCLIEINLLNEMIGRYLGI